MKWGLFIALAAVIGQAGSPSKERAWQEGMLLNPENNAYFLSVPRMETNASPLQPITAAALRGEQPVASTAITSTKDSYVLDAGDAAYLVERVRLTSSKPANVYITMQVKFFVEKKKLYMIDREGREVELHIVKQARKDSAASGQ
jgi:hypothetical protein